MTLADIVHVARRFQRSIRVDTDFGDPTAIEGFVCPQTFANVLESMAKHVKETGHGAFTWTGPFGSGKSSLCVVLAGLLGTDANAQKQARKVLGRKLSNTIIRALPTGDKGWNIVPVMGRRGDATQILGEALETSGLSNRKSSLGWTDKKLISTLKRAVEGKSTGGVLVLVDEMGKLLEAAARDGQDLFIFQQLAEAASRSGGRLVFVGVLHQAFAEYANTLSRDMRDEWTKIQGRFLDLSVSISASEQLELLAQAIQSESGPEKSSKAIKVVAYRARNSHSNELEKLENNLNACWPLHPVVASLLGPISRRRFGQNQRSIFGFLNSAEPHGFQEFLSQAGPDLTFLPNKLWDYLKANLEPTILASPDGHRWALVAHTLELCESRGGDKVDSDLLKTIGVINLFKEQSGLLASTELLYECFPGTSKKAIKQSLAKLMAWSLTQFKKYEGAYAIFAGSDFDIEHALRKYLGNVLEIDFSKLETIAGLQPILAKRHYHKTGTMRWFERGIIALKDLPFIKPEELQTNGAVGRFVLAVPTEFETFDQATQLCKNAVRKGDGVDLVVGVSTKLGMALDYARELIALTNIASGHVQLRGDDVARLEVKGRIATLEALLESELNSALDSVTWYRKNHQIAKSYSRAGLSQLASELADKQFSKCPILHNELLNRSSPSPSAVTARNELLHRMISQDNIERLGIKGFSAAGGLYLSILESSGLHQKTKDGWGFVKPRKGDKVGLRDAWERAEDHLKKNSSRTVPVSEIFELWRAPPFGIKDGLHVVLALAFILSYQRNVAVYREGVFRTRFEKIDVEYLSGKIDSIQLRWIDLSKRARDLLSGMADTVRSFDRNITFPNLEPIDVGRGLISIFDQLPNWTKRTMRLSPNAVRLRDLFKRAKDPNKLLFNDLPKALGSKCKKTAEIVSGVEDGLSELVEAYPSMIQRLGDLMLSELQVPNRSRQTLSELSERAENIRQLAGDFLLDAFIGRLSQFDGSDEGVESIASLVANKPPRDWIDTDLDRASVEIVDMAQRFLRAETFARVKNRPAKRQALAVIIGRRGGTAPLLEQFDIGDADLHAVDDLINRLATELTKGDAAKRNIILAALAELSAQYIEFDAKSKSSFVLKGRS